MLDMRKSIENLPYNLKYLKLELQFNKIGIHEDDMKNLEEGIIKLPKSL